MVLQNEKITSLKSELKKLEFYKKFLIADRLIMKINEKGRKLI